MRFNLFVLGLLSAGVLAGSSNQLDTQKPVGDTLLSDFQTKKADTRAYDGKYDQYQTGQLLKAESVQTEVKKDEVTTGPRYEYYNAKWERDANQGVIAGNYQANLGGDQPLLQTTSTIGLAADTNKNNYSANNVDSNSNTRIEQSTQSYSARSTNAADQAATDLAASIGELTNTNTQQFTTTASDVVQNIIIPINTAVEATNQSSNTAQVAKNVTADIPLAVTQIKVDAPLLIAKPEVQIQEPLIQAPPFKRVAQPTYKDTQLNIEQQTFATKTSAITDVAANLTKLLDAQQTVTITPEKAVTQQTQAPQLTATQYTNFARQPDQYARLQREQQEVHNQLILTQKTIEQRQATLELQPQDAVQQVIIEAPAQQVTAQTTTLISQDSQDIIRRQQDQLQAQVTLQQQQNQFHNQQAQNAAQVYEVNQQQYQARNNEVRYDKEAGKPLRVAPIKAFYGEIRKQEQAKIPAPNIVHAYENNIVIKPVKGNLVSLQNNREIAVQVGRVNKPHGVGHHGHGRGHNHGQGRTQKVLVEVPIYATEKKAGKLQLQRHQEEPKVLPCNK